MKKRDKETYLAPTLEWQEIDIEQGFAASPPGQLPEFDDDDDEIVVGSYY